MKKYTLQTLVAISAGCLAMMPVSAAEVVAPRVIDAATTWSANNTYILEGYTFVVTPAGAAVPTVLTIEPGTVIKAQESAGANAAALVITRGARINASGTASNPIIFTSVLDDLNGNLGHSDASLWGGVVILGNASINSRADDQIVPAPVEDQVEGLDVSGDEIGFASFGGTNDDDDSGVLRYASIRHGGAVIGGDNEINGLTLGGVGRGTTIEFIEVFANKDDGVEFFGGTVDVRYLALAFGQDDSVDFDQGWRGRGQFIFTIGTDIGTDRMDKGGEWDGATSPVDATPLGASMLANLTYVGIGPSGAANTALNIRDNAGVMVYNSVFLNFDKMIDIEDDNLARFTAGDIDLRNSVWWSHVGANNSAAGFNARPAGAVDSTIFWTDNARNNTIADPLLGGVSYEADGGLDPRPMTGSPALTAPFATLPDDDWFVQTEYKGAFAPNGPTWLQGWTKLSTEGYLANVGRGSELVNVSTRCYVSTGDAVAIPGFVITGSVPKTVLIRAVGTDGIGTGTVFNIAGTLDDPTIELVRQGTGGGTVAVNDNWGDNANVGEIQAAMAAVFAFGVPVGSRDAMLLVSLEPGAYTVVTRGVGGTEGIAVVEAYIAD